MRITFSFTVTTMLSRKEALQQIFASHGEEAVYIVPTGYIAREAYNLIPNSKNVFYMQGSMGLAPAIGVGIAVNSSKDVVVVTGDAALLMHLGITHTIRDLNLSNLYVYVLDNHCHESVGGMRCSALEGEYLGIHSVIEVECGGKPPRVELDCVTNKIQIMELLDEES